MTIICGICCRLYRTCRHDGEPPTPMAKSISFHSSKRKPDRKRTSFCRIVALAFCSFQKGVFIRRIAQSPPILPPTALSPSCIQSLGVVFRFFSLLYPFLLYPDPDISIPGTLLSSGFASAHPALRIVFIPGLGRRLHLRQSFNLTTTNYPALLRFARNTTDTFPRGKSLFTLYHYCHYYILFHFDSLLESPSPYSLPTGAATAGAIPGFSDKAIPRQTQHYS